MKNWKKVSSTLILASSLLIAGCGGGTESTSATEDTNPDKGLEVQGENVQFDPNKLVNNGEPIKLEWWMWDATDIFQQAVDGYEEIYPNVEIEIINQPWEDMWTKLPLALNGEDGPALFNMHNSQHNNLVENMAPYDIPVEDLEADFIGVENHIYDGEVYYIDFGRMTGTIYYNKDHWEEAGLTEEDIPTTWEELAEVGQTLTVKEGDQIQRSGFNTNGQNYLLLMALAYQQGENLFAEDGQTPLINTEAKQSSVQQILDFYEQYETGHRDFGPDAGESFGQGATSMVYNWGHFNGLLNEQYPDINFGVFELPSYDGETPYAYDRYNGESTLGINQNISEEQMEVAQDFVKYYLTNEELQIDLALNYSVFPAKNTLAENEEILAHPVLSAVADTIEYRIWPGPMPAVVESALETAMQDIVYNNVDIESALQTAEDSMAQDIQGSDFESKENLYRN